MPDIVNVDGGSHWAWPVVIVVGWLLVSVAVVALLDWLV